MKNKLKIREFITVAIASLVTTSAIAADTSKTTREKVNEVFQEKCEFLNEDEAWITFCVLLMDVEWQTANTIDDVDISEEDVAKTAFYNPDNWHNRKLWNSLSVSQKTNIYYHLSAGLAHIAYYEWACSTEKFSRRRSDAIKFTQSIVNKKTAELLLTKRNEELERMGYGLERGPCKYEEFYVTKKSFLRQREKMTSLLQPTP